MAVIGVNYEEGNKANLNYKSVYIHATSKKQNKLFDSGDFVKDWFNALKYFHQNQEKLGHLSGSSTCDHFIMDGASFSSAYLHIVNGKPVLKYIDYKDKNYIHTQREIYEDGYEYFVAKDTQPTWEELKEYCRNNEK